MKLSMILARSMDNVIGINNDIPWKCPADMRKFREITSRQYVAVAMGRNTWESLPVKPLPHRINIVITSKPGAITCSHPGVALPVASIDEAIQVAKDLGAVELVFMGGKGIYEEAVKIVDEVYITEMNWNTLSDNDAKPEEKVYFDYHFDYHDFNPDQSWTVLDQYTHLERDGEKVDEIFEFFHLKRK